MSHQLYQTVVSGKDISESSYQTALASTLSAGPDVVANIVEGYDNIEDDMQQYVNANCWGKWRFNSKYLKKIHIVVFDGKYKKTRNGVLTVLSKISKMRRWSPNYIAICNHSIKKLQVTLDK